MHPDFAVRSQAYDLPIVRLPNAKRTVLARFEIATGVVPIEPVRPSMPLTLAECHEDEPHPRSLPDGHPEKVAWAAKVSASKSGQSISVAGRHRHSYRARPCECCMDAFFPTSGPQKHCASCRERIPTDLRCARGRIAWNMRRVGGRHLRRPKRTPALLIGGAR